MIALRVKDLKKGMVSAKDVKDRTGRLILATGKEITVSHIKTFKAWGVTEVTIKESSAEETEPLSQRSNLPVEVFEKLQKEMNDLFRYADKDHPAMLELFDLCLMRKVELSQKEPKADEA